LLCVLLPFQFDSKSSPLALLAQTCSAIGSDAPNPKLLANIEKSTKRDKSSPASNGSPVEVKSSFKPYESSLKDNDAPDDLRVASRIKPQSKPLPSHNGHERSESTHSASSQHTRKSPPTTSPKTSNEKTSNSSASAKSTTPSEPVKSDMQKEALRSLAGAAGYPSMPYFNGYPYPYSMELLSQHQSMLKAAALNPYLNYARMKAAAGANDMMMGICRDPYCTGCSLSSHFMGKNGSQCPPGCTCDHSTAKAMTSNPAAAMAYHAQLAQLAAASQMPYV
jgi:hypothetical protein